MSETLEYIDSYFTEKLTASEKAAFESRCEMDTEFAEEVAFYISALGSLKDELNVQKKKEFDALYKELSSAKTEASKGTLRKIFPYIATAAAACLLIFIGLQLFLNNGSSKQLADKYISDNLQQLSITMGSQKDSLQSGIAAFNDKNYKEAEKIFKPLAANQNAEAIKNLGSLYLITGDYDKAITQFEMLANQKNLYVNPGLFYEAVTLMKRDQKGDEEKAKSLLEEVIRKDLPGRKEAEIWIKKL